VEVDSDTINRVSEPQANDLSHYKISQQPGDRWKYKTATLRNISLTAPYMHNGSLATLKQVVRFYNQGGAENENLDFRINPLGLNETEINDLVEFLRSLTGANINELLGDSFAAPMGDIR
jgi:cytochrome c peroxidase